MDLATDRKHYNNLQENKFSCFNLKDCFLVQPTENWAPKGDSLNPKPLTATDLKLGEHFTFEKLSDLPDFDHLATDFETMDQDQETIPLESRLWC